MSKLTNLYMSISQSGLVQKADMTASQFKSLPLDTKWELIRLWISHLENLELRIVQDLVDGNINPSRCKEIQQSIKVIYKQYKYACK